VDVNCRGSVCLEDVFEKKTFITETFFELLCGSAVNKNCLIQNNILYRTPELQNSRTPEL